MNKIILHQTRLHRFIDMSTSMYVGVQIITYEVNIFYRLFV